MISTCKRVEIACWKCNRGEKQGGCATRVGDIKEHRGREVDKSHQSRGVSSSCHGVDSGSLVDENTERPPLGR